MTQYSLLPLVIAALLPLAPAHASGNAESAALSLVSEAEMLCSAQDADQRTSCQHAVLLPDELAARDRKARTDAAIQADLQSYYAMAAEQLLKNDQPRATLLAARLLRVSAEYHPDGPRQDGPAQAVRVRVGELARAAALRAGDDPIVLWSLAMGTFRNEAPELAEPAVARLKALQPDNLAVWFAGENTGTWSTERVLEAGRTTRFDFAYLERMRADVSLLEPIALPQSVLDSTGDPAIDSVGALQVMVFDLLMAEAMPAYQGVTAACTPGDTGWLPAHRPACERMANTMIRESDSQIGVSIGSGLLKRLADTDAARLAADVAVKQSRFHIEQLQRATLKLGGQSSYLALLRGDCPTELACAKQFITDAGLSLEMPADWQPMTEAERQALLASFKAGGAKP